MADFLVADRVKETSTTTGTGTLTLAGAVTGYQSFAIIGNANYTYYVIEDGTYWETGIGLYTSSGTSLTRNVIASSNSNNAVDWSAGSKNVFCSRPATEDLSSTVVKTANYTATVRDSIILCDTSGGDVVITLPTIAAAFTGKRFMIKKISTDMNELKIQDGGSSGFDALADEYLFANGEFVEVMGRHTGGSAWNWTITSKHLIPGSASMRNASAQSISASTWTKLTFDTTLYEQNGCDANHGASNSITCKRAGVYTISGTCTLGLSSSADVWIGIAVVTGGAAPGSGDVISYVLNRAGSGSVNDWLGGITQTAKLAAGDDVYLMLYHNESSFTPPSTMSTFARQYPRFSVVEST